jgi:hypothetical protein
VNPVLIGALAWIGAIVAIVAGHDRAKRQQRRAHTAALKFAAQEALRSLDPDPEYVNVSDLLDRIEPYRQAADEAIEQANSWPSHTVPPRYVVPNPYPPYPGGQR